MKRRHYGTGQKNKSKSRGRSSASNRPPLRKARKTSMEVAFQVVLTLGGIATIIAAVLLTTHHRDFGIWFGCLACCLGVIGFFCWLQNSVWEHAVVSTPAKPSPDPTTLIFSKPSFPYSVKKIRVFSGGKVGNYFISDLKNESQSLTSAYKSDQYSYGKIYIKDGIFCFDTETIGEISVSENNIPTLKSGWQFNRNDDAFEIVDDEGRPVYQLWFASQDEVHISGAFLNETVTPPLVFNLGTNEYWQFLPVGYFLPQKEICGELRAELRIALDPIFKYPSRLHPGELSSEPKGTALKQEIIRRELLVPIRPQLLDDFSSEPNRKLLFVYKDSEYGKEEALKFSEVFEKKGWQCALSSENKDREGFDPEKLISIVSSGSDGITENASDALFKALKPTGCARGIDRNLDPNTIKIVINRR